MAEQEPAFVFVPVGALFALSMAAGAFEIQQPALFQPGAPGQAGRELSPSQAVELSRSSYTAQDVRFLQHMMLHHAQAIEMVELLRTRGVDPGLRRLAERIALGQSAELALMKDWLEARGQPAEAAAMLSHTDHSHPAARMMTGMLSESQMQELVAARGGAFDRLFLEGMIQHHLGALEMVDELMAHSDSAEDPVLSDLLSSIVSEQSAEILRMQSMLPERPPASEDRP
jgi:uncharacterized protein (DUF305 family)